MNRRLFLRSGALAMASWGVDWGFGGRLALAAEGGARSAPALVVIFQRGAMDALAAVPPVDDRQLAGQRPGIALRSGRAGPMVDLDGVFGLHPALTPLHGAWSDGRLAVVHAVGSPSGTRSHFDAQDAMEIGIPGQRTGSGWLNRTAELVDADDDAFHAVAAARVEPRSLAGDHDALTVESLARLQVSRPRRGPDAELLGRLQTLYDRQAAEPLRGPGLQALRATDRAISNDLARIRPAAGVRYPESPLGQALRQLAVLVKAEVGLRVGFAESTGWDTHVGQGGVSGGFARAAADLATSIAAFWKDLGRYRDTVLVLTMTEFGRTVAENGSGGTDHGHGSLSFLLGAFVDGGRVHGSLPPLDRENLFEGRDLPVTTDFRSVLAEVAGSHLGIPSPARLFPGWNGARIPLIL